MTTYTPDYLRLAEQAPTSDDARKKWFKRRAPLGDAEFYYEVCPDIGANLEDELFSMICRMRDAFSAGKSLRAYGPLVRDWLQRYRRSRPEPAHSGPRMPVVSVAAMNARSNTEGWKPVEDGAPERIFEGIRLADRQYHLSRQRRAS